MMLGTMPPAIQVPTRAPTEIRIRMAPSLGDAVDCRLFQGFVIVAELDAESHDDEPGDEQCQLDWQIQHAGVKEKARARKMARQANTCDMPGNRMWCCWFCIDTS